ATPGIITLPTVTPTPGPSPAPTALAPVATTAPVAGMQARIEIVWPHNGAPVSQADQANVTAYLFADGNLNPVSCSATPTVRLWMAQNSEPATFVGRGDKRLATDAGRTFPVWDFNDVDVSAARNPANTLHFFVTVDEESAAHNVWSHGSSPLTRPAAVRAPSGVAAGRPLALDARIVSVQSAGNLPVAQATRGMLSVHLFVANSLQAVVGDRAWQPDVRLHWAVNSGVDQAPQGIAGAPRSLTVGNVTFTAWDFADFDLSLARDPANQIYFWVDVPGVPTFSNVWVYGADTRTYHPLADVPARGCR
ncbi:MAG: hypothetical protein WA077_05590, partial [Anaerolineae bacterium]